MIPPMLMTPAAKLLGMALIVGLLWGWGYMTGRSHVQQAWDASVTAQAVATSQQLIAEATMSNTVMKEHAEEVREAASAAAILEREVIRYVQAPDKPCVVDAEFERLFDALSRMPESAADRVPAADAGAGEPAQSQETGATLAEVLQAYHRAVEELTFLWIDYDALVQWERGRYIVQQAQQEIPETP